MKKGLQHSSTRLRIHGDNILECERTLYLISDAFNATVNPIPSAAYAPWYSIQTQNSTLFQVELLAGYGPWEVDIQRILSLSYNAPLREAPDAIVTRARSQSEEIVLALEFCNALPAGNNA